MPDIDEVTILPTVDLDDLRVAVYVLAAAQQFIIRLADAMAGVAAATGEFHDELSALLQDQERKAEQ